MKTMSDFYAAAIVGLEGYIDEEEDDIRLGEGVAKVGEYTFAMQEDGVDEISERKSRLATLEGDLQALIDAASPGTANSPAIAQMRDLVDEITAVYCKRSDCSQERRGIGGIGRRDRALPSNRLS